jgi:hypothetical protein
VGFFMRQKDAVLAQADCRRIKKRAQRGFLALLSPPLEVRRP